MTSQIGKFSIALATLAVWPGAALTVPSAGSKAPEASESARYCLKIEAVTGTRLERVRCHTRAEWAELDVDVDAEWAREGVRVIS